MTQRPDLIVPVRDRRQGRRVLTTKTVLGSLLVATAIFAAVTVRSEMRGKVGDDYGRLFGKQVGNHEDLAKPVYDVVKEAPVNDQTAADPMLTAGAAREQLLIDSTSTATTTSATIAPVETPISMATTAPIGTGEGVTIVGGADGVTIVKGTQKRPTLSGGIFKN